MDETSALIEAILREQEEEEEEAHRRRRNLTTQNTTIKSNNQWQTVSYHKRNRNNNKSSSKQPLAADPSPDVFSSVQRHSEHSRRRLLESQIASEAEAAAAAAPSRSKRHSDDEDDGDAEHEASAVQEVKKAKQKKPKKPKVTVAEAASRISADDLDAFLAEITASYESQQDIMLMRFADYFGRAFSSVSAAQFPWLKTFKESTVAKIVDIPLLHISEDIYKISTDWISHRSYEALGSFVLWSLDSILSDLASHQGVKKAVQQSSSKSQVAMFVVLTMVLRRKPDVLISLLPILKENKKYQGQDKLPVIVWVITQASQGDLVMGLYLWVYLLLPMLSVKSGCNPQSRDLILQLVERIITFPKAHSILLSGAVRKGERVVPPWALDSLLRVTFPLHSARVKATERFEAVYPTLREVALAGSAESFIGCFISLISKCEIRYEGVLYFLNIQDSTIGLKNVRSYGTEGRKKDGPQVPSSDKVYEYILFRGNDIKNLQIKSPTPSSKSEEQVFSDPAVIQSEYSGLRSSPVGELPSSPVAGLLSSPVASVGGRSLTESIQRQDSPAISSKAFPSGLPSHQSVTQLGPSNLSDATQVASHPSFSAAMYWQGPSGISSSSYHSLLQSSSLHPTSLAASLVVQNQMQNAETQVPINGGWTGLSEYGLPVSSAMTSLVNQTHSPSLTSLKNSDSLDIPSLLSTKTPVSYSPSMTFDGSNMPQFSSTLQDINSIQAQISGNICPDPRPIHPQHSVHRSAPSYVDSTSGSLPTATSLLTPDQFAYPREQLLSLSHLNPTQKDMGSLTLTSSGSSALIPSPASQAPLLPLPTSVQKPPYTAPQYTEEFDFEAMNEKFKKDEVWGSLGKTTTKIEGVANNASLSLGDRECHGVIPNPKTAYKKDDFFDTISCNSLTHGSRNGQNRFSERMKQDTETFGNFQQRPNFTNGGYGAGRGANFRGSNNWGRGYGYNGRGRGPNFPF